MLFLNLFRSDTVDLLLVSLTAVPTCFRDLGNCLADILGKVENLFLLLRTNFHPAVFT